MQSQHFSIHYSSLPKTDWTGPQAHDVGFPNREVRKFEMPNAIVTRAGAMACSTDLFKPALTALT
jgi:hypothetical protein